MKKTLLVLATSLVLLPLAGCGGGMSDEEQAAADSLAKSWSGADAKKAQKQNNQCVTEKWVSAAGIDELEKAKAVDKDGKAVGNQPPAKMSKGLATDFGNAVADCFDIRASKADVKASMPGVSDKQLGAYLDCMDKIDRDLIAQAVRDGRLGVQKSKPNDDLETVVKNCQAKAQAPTG